MEIWPGLEKGRVAEEASHIDELDPHSVDDDSQTLQ